MKKIIISLVLVAMLFGGNVAHAQTISSQANLQALQNTYRAFIMQLIQILTQRINELQAQLAVLQAKQAVQQSVIAPIQNEPVIEQPIVGTQIITTSTEATSTPPTVSAPAPQLEYTPTIRLEIIGTRVLWSATGERFNCTLNGESVWQEGARETNGITSFTLGCVGTVSGVRLNKTIQ